MPSYIIDTPKGAMKITAPDEATGLRVLRSNGAKYGITADTPLKIRPQDSIEVTDKNQASFPEADAVMQPPQDGPAKPKTVGKVSEDFLDQFSFEPNEKGEARMKDKSFMQKMGMIDQAFGKAITSGMTAGYGPAIESRLRPNLPESVNKALFYEKPLDQLLQEGADVAGPGTMVVGEGVGFALNPATKWLPSVRTKGSGLGPAASRTAKSIGENAVLSGGEELIRPDDTSAAGASLESIIPTATINTLLEGLFHGKSKIAKTAREWKVPQNIRDQGEALPIVESILKNAPDGTPLPGSNIMARGGEPAVNLAQAVSGQAPVEYNRLRRGSTRQMEGEGQRLRNTVDTLSGSPVRSPTAREAELREQRNRVNPRYTPALQARLPNNSAWINRGSRAEPQNERVTVPRVHRDTLTSDPDFYDAYAKARDGEDGGAYRAKVHARERGAPEPGQAETNWETIKKLKESSSDADVRLGKILQREFGGVNTDLRDLVRETRTFRRQERGVRLGAAAYKDPTKLNSPQARESFSDPAARKEVEDGFLGAALDEVDKGKIPDLTDARLAAAHQLLGPDRMRVLQQRIAEEVRSREIHGPISRNEGGSPLGAMEQVPPSAWKKLLRGGSHVLRGALGGGGPGAIAGMGQAAAQFMRDNPNALSQGQIRGLLDIFAMDTLPNIKKPSKFESAQNRVGTNLSRAYMDETKRKRRGDK